MILADLYLETFNEEKAALLYTRLMAGDLPFPKPTAGVEAYLLLRVGQTLEFQHRHDEATACLMRLYDPRFASYPWAGEGIFRIGTWTYNATQDPKQAMGHLRTSSPTCRTAPMPTRHCSITPRGRGDEGLLDRRRGIPRLPRAIPQRAVGGADRERGVARRAPAHGRQGELMKGRGIMKWRKSTLVLHARLVFGSWACNSATAQVPINEAVTCKAVPKTQANATGNPSTIEGSFTSLPDYRKNDEIDVNQPANLRGKSAGVATSLRMGRS